MATLFLELLRGEEEEEEEESGCECGSPAEWGAGSSREDVTGPVLPTSGRH